MKNFLLISLFTFCSQLLSAQNQLHMNPDAISFCGGGRCIGYELGAYIASRNFVDYSNTKIITATSAGSIVALAHVLEFTDDEIKTLWVETNIKELRGKKKPHFAVGTPNSYLFTGDGIKEIVERMLEMKKVDRNITIKQLSEKLGVELYFMATMIDTKTKCKTPIVFGDSLHADIPVSLAARISCAVPNYIKPYGCDSTATKIDTLSKKKHRYYLIDGNAFEANNLPIEYAVDKVKSRNVLGFYIWNSGKTNEKKLLDRLAFNKFGKTTDELVRDMLQENHLEGLVLNLNANSTAPTLKKSVTAQDRAKMFDEGNKQAEEWFEKEIIISKK